MSDVSVLVRSAVRVSLRRQRSLLLLLILFVTTVLISNGLVGAGVSKYADSVQYRSALNLIELSSVSAAARRQLDDQTLSEVAKLDRVTGVYPYAQIDLALSDATDWPDLATNPGALFATPLVPGLAPVVLAGALPAAGLGPQEIALPRDVPGGRLDRLLGRKVTMEFTRQVTAGQGEPSRRAFTVVAIIDNSTPGAAGLTPSYLAQDTLFGLIRASGASGSRPLSYPTAYVRTASPDDVPQVQRALAARGFAVRSAATQLSSLTGLFRTLSYASYLLGALLVLVCLSVGGLIGATWVQQKTREIGLLKAIGWTRRRITAALMLQLALVGVLAGITGTALGALGSLVTTTIVAGQHIELLPVDSWQTPSPALLALTAVLVPLCVVLGGLRSAVKATGIDADEALRDL